MSVFIFSVPFAGLLHVDRSRDEGRARRARERAARTRCTREADIRSRFFRAPHARVLEIFRVRYFFKTVRYFWVLSARLLS